MGSYAGMGRHMLGAQPYRFVEPHRGGIATLRRWFASKATSGSAGKVAGAKKSSVPDLKKKLKALGLPVSGTKDELILRLQIVATDQLTVDDIKEQLKALGLPVGGKKEDLVARLQQATAGSGGQIQGRSSRRAGRGGGAAGGKEEKLSIEEEYQKMSPVEHVLLRPDIYVGAMQVVQKKTMVVTDFGKSDELGLDHRSISYVPGLLKIFDEILVNAADNKVRDASMDTLEVTLNAAKATITVLNNGRGMPVAIHEDEGVYVPQLIMGNLLTGSNFDDTRLRITGGRHGYGAKLTNIFSRQFTVETADTSRGLSYKQTWHKNMSRCDPPEIQELKPRARDFTKISFTIDLDKFRMKALGDDIVGLFARRVMDVAGIHPSIRCTFNGKSMAPGSFRGLAQQFLGLAAREEGKPGQEASIPGHVFLENDRWKVVVAAATGSVANVSYVNGVWTSRGGDHVSHVTDQVARGVLSHCQTRKRDKDITLSQVQRHVWVAVSAMIENPVFDSQAKEQLVSPEATFGSSIDLDEKDIARIVAETSIVEDVLADVQMRHLRDMEKTKVAKAGTRSNSRLLVPKLEDANDAGGAHSKHCTLILTEGDSAKSLAVGSLSVVGRDRYGVFPLKGKVLNVREASNKQLRENAEIAAIKTILGLQHSKRYEKREDDEGLRYGRVMLMTDQDHDGSHIKGLVINMLHHFWPALLKRKGYIVEFVTPLVKAFPRSAAGKGSGREVKSFYTSRDFESWHGSLSEVERLGWKIKYYKGLGTNNSEEGKAYFKQLENKHKIEMVWRGDEDGEAISMAFGSDANLRKEWLTANPPDTTPVVDHSIRELSFRDFVYKELIQYSHAAVSRSIPNAIDGCKPGQRKVLFSCFDEKLDDEVKIAQLAGIVSAKTQYHHGEASLHETMIKMAQNFVGSNNLPLLHPMGQFGTRLQGGNDAASPRYIYTRLSSYSRLIYREEDDAVLDLKKEDGSDVEPLMFVPIIPTILVNGAHGIGTGWSTSIPQYCPLEVIDIVAAAVKGTPSDALPRLDPWYAGFEGKIDMHKSSSKDVDVEYVSHGRIAIPKPGGRSVRVTELPIGMWTGDFKDLLDKLCQEGTVDGGALVQNYTESSTESTVDFEVMLTKSGFDQLSSRQGKKPVLQEQPLIKVLKLKSKLLLSNMMAIGTDGVIKRYTDPRQIIADFMGVRRLIYAKRKEYQLAQLGIKVLKAKNRAKFVEMVAGGGLTLAELSKTKLEGELERMGYERFERSASGVKDYDYLTSMPILSCTSDKLAALQAEAVRLDGQLALLKGMAIEDIWLSELAELKAEVVKYYKERGIALKSR